MVPRLSQSTIRPPPSSPSLIALLELIPPSPVLSPSDLSTAITSGEISILLFENSFSTAVPFDGQHDSYSVFLDSSPRSWEFDLSRSTLLIADHDLDGLSFHVPRELSNEYLDHTSIGLDTFGRSVRGTTRHRSSLCWSSNTAAGDFIRDGTDFPQDDDMLVYYEDSWIGASQWDHPLPSPALSEDRSQACISDPLEQRYDDGVHLTDTKCASLQDSTLVGAQSEGYNLAFLTTTNSVSSLQKGCSSLSATQDDSYSGEISSIEFCVRETSSTRGVSTLASTSSLSRRPAIHRACGSPKCRKEFPALNPTGDAVALQRSQIPNVQAMSRQDAVATDRGIGSISSGSPDIQFSAAVVAAHKLPSPSRSPFTPRVLHPSSPQTCITTPRDRLQQQYSWLKNVTLSLLIDQEGFRTIQPLFKPTGFSRHHLVESGNTKIDVVTFVPTAREAFRFHYAPFDGLPILRRLTINGDESRDFLSRQAYLSLKSSGMYTVHGTEIASPIVAATLAPSPSLSDNTEATQALDFAKLYWQFDYSVEDRRAEQTGRIMDGEKILVPHTFTCSPPLLHPSQGKKVKLIQIVKKTVAPKLTAERKPPPSLHLTPGAPTTAPPVPTIPSSPLRKANIVQHATQLYLNKSQAWNLHRRSQSNPRETPQTSFSPPKPSWSTRHRNSESTDSPSVSSMIAPIPIPQRRRRASSAGESHNQLRTGISPIRHILPPSRLRQLLEEGSGSEQETIKNPEIPQDRLVQESDFFPLKPSPRIKN